MPQIFFYPKLTIGRNKVLFLASLLLIFNFQPSNAGLYVRVGALDSTSKYKLESESRSVTNSWAIGYAFLDNRLGFAFGQTKMGSFVFETNETTISSDMQGNTFSIFYQPWFNYESFIQPYGRLGVVSLDADYNYDSNLYSEPSSTIGSFDIGAELMSKYFFGIPISIYGEYGTTAKHDFFEELGHYSVGIRVLFTRMNTRFKEYASDQTNELFYLDRNNSYNKRKNTNYYLPFSQKELFVMRTHPFKQLYICRDNSPRHYAQIGVFRSNSREYKIIVQYLRDSLIPHLTFKASESLNNNNEILVAGSFRTKAELNRIIRKLEQTFKLGTVIDYCNLEKKLVKLQADSIR